MSEKILIGLQLTVYGMGLVFLLLGALWAIVTVMLRLDRVAAPAAPPAPPERPVALPALPLAGQPAPELLAAITVAVLAHRAIRRRQAAPAMRSHPPGSLPNRWVALGRGQQTRGWQPPKR
jgi:sodium pump decarboxylase gamma subunit